MRCLIDMGARENLKKEMECPIPGGFLVAFEGIDGAGKTTQAAMLSALCRESNLKHSVSKEPTNGRYGAVLRASAQTGRLSPKEELDLFLKDRQEHVEGVIAPALKREEIVILDRYYFSTAAYQGARGADPDLIIESNEAFAPKPDLLVILDVPPSLGLARIIERNDAPNKFETEESLLRARAIFNALRLPYLHWVDAKTGPDIIHFHVVQAFRTVAMNKIAQHDLSPSDVNRTRLLFGELPINIGTEFSFT
jgi:dTMP kinase